MRKAKIPDIAKRANKPVQQLLTELFEKHGNMTSVAKELGVDVSTVSVGLLRAGLKCKTIVVPRTE